jgi:2,3-diaminopropionate biosynthesis protein SbnB
MRNGDILILRGHEVSSLLSGRELELIDTVRNAYETHASGHSSLPHSTFLRFPDNECDRVIALPAYLGDDFGVAGIKWVASFPRNLEKGLDRASAVVILNSHQTGRPEALIEGSTISAKRTAASAALAARTLHQAGEACDAGLIGCGLINFEIARFLRAAFPQIKGFGIFDLDPGRANKFGDKLRGEFNGVEVEIAGEIETVLSRYALVSIATTATKPHIYDLSGCRPGATILHISLRDLSADSILSCDNVVDDIDHVCRAETSLHLAERLVSNRDFIRCVLADITSGKASARRDADSVTVFSPFGLGVLDLAVSKLVRELALTNDQGIVISSFLPDSWLEDKKIFAK